MKEKDKEGVKSYSANQPAPIKFWSLALWGKVIPNALCRFGKIVFHTITPFEALPGLPLDPPSPSKPVCAEVIAQCERIYDRAESSREYLEQKARSTFTLIAFFSPLLISAFLFVYQSNPSGSKGSNFGLVMFGFSGTLLMLAFISVARAVSVQPRETLFLESVIDSERGDFRAYRPSRYARGLLYCASVNSAMNAHIAQFVKGAQVLTTVALIVACISVIPLLLELPSNKMPTEVVITSQVSLESKDLVGLQLQLERIAEGVGSNGKSNKIANDLDLIRDDLASLQELLKLIFEYQECSVTQSLPINGDEKNIQ